MDPKEYTQRRGDGEQSEEEDKPIRYLLPLDILAEDEAVYGDVNGPAVMIKRADYNDNGRPQHVTLILGKEPDED